MSDVKITQNGTASAGEYCAHVPGSDQIGRLTWVQRGKVRHAEHTLVPPEIGGKGVAAQLVEALIADCRKHDLKISPDCSYVEAAFRRHPDWAELRAG